MSAPVDYRIYPVVYVDDQRSNRWLMQQSLSETFDVYVAEGGEEALAIAQGMRTGILVTDHRMPGMSGLELAARFKELFPQGERVMVTGSSGSHELTEALASGLIAAVLIKPVPPETLTAVLKKLMAKLAARGA